MSVIRRWTIKVCRECGSNVHTDECRFTGPLTNAPSDEVEVVPLTDYRGAVDRLRDLVGNSGHLCDPPRIKECAKCRAEAFLASLDHPGGQ